VIDLAILEKAGLFNGPLLSGLNVFDKPTLNSFIELGKDHWHEARVTI
jgi:fumarylacetoacetase